MDIYMKNNNECPHDMEIALNLGKIYSEAGLTPFYVYDQLNDSFIVTSKENVDKRLN